MPMSFRNSLIPLALGSILLLPGCAALDAQDDETAERLDQLEDRLAQIERLVDSDSLIDLAASLEEIQSELRGLRGDVELLQHQQEGIQERQRETYLDLDRRLRRLEVGGAPTGTPDLQEDELAGLDAGEERGAADPAEAYQAAFELLREGRYDAAGEAFDAFLVDHADSDLGANARYWLGEVHYVTRDFEQASEEFRRVLDDYPGSNKEADAALKLGFAYYELEQWDQARDMLEEVRRSHPDTSAARLAGNRLNRMADEGR